MRRSVLLAVVLSVAGSPHAARADVTREIRAELPASALSRFVVENLVGTMRVSAGEGPGVVAIATVHADNDDLAGAVRFEQVEGGPPAEESGAPTLRVRYPLDRHSTLRYQRGEETQGWLIDHLIDIGRSKLRYDGHDVSIGGRTGPLLYVDVEVRVPGRDVGATFRNLIGRLEARGISGTLRFDSSSGDITLATVSGDLAADTGSGDVKATGVRGSLSCDTGSGDCSITDVDVDRLSADTGSGDVVVRSGRAGKVRGDTGSGNVRALDLDLVEFVVDTGSGDVELSVRSAARLRRIKADTGSGDVVLRLGPDASFEALADQGSGDIVNRYADAQPILERKELVGYRRGSGTIRISVDTGSGDLTLDPGLSEARGRRAAPDSSPNR